MSPRLALALDTIIWTCATAALFVVGFIKTAMVVGIIGTLYLSYCVVIMIRIMKIEQVLPMLGEEFDDLDDERDYH